MELTRRDALVALAASGVAVGWRRGAGRIGHAGLRSGRRWSLEARHRHARRGGAASCIPSEITGVREFVTTYALGRTEDRPEYREGMTHTVSLLDTYSNEWHDANFVELDGETRDDLLHEMGAARADPDPEGSDAERVRYYLVNDVLFALFTSPTGGKLVGTENPLGYPGGLDSYRRGTK